MDAVTTILLNRSRRRESVGSVLGASVLAHTLLLIAVVAMPVTWFGGMPREPENVLRISLGAAGPVTGGLSTLSSRPVQQVLDNPKVVQPIRPPAAREPEMVEPVKDAPKKVQPAQVEAKDPRSRTPTKGKELESGTAAADTSARGQGFGLSSGGFGGGVKLDVADFCCPEYLATMRDLIYRNWNSKQQADGITWMRFVIRRDGRLGSIQVDQSSGTPALDYFSQRALQLVGQFPPLPPAYTGSELTVRLAFEYRR
jgi:TonB family protein